MERRDNIVRVPLGPRWPLQPIKPGGRTSAGAGLPLDPLLSHILRPNPAPSATALLASQVAGWPALIAAAEPHGLLPLLAWSLARDCPDAVPAPVLEQLQGRLRANTRRVLELSAELLRILGLFVRAGIQAVPFKGPVAAWSLYENPGLRDVGPRRARPPGERPGRRRASPHRRLQSRLRRRFARAVPGRQRTPPDPRECPSTSTGRFCPLITGFPPARFSTAPFPAPSPGAP